MSSELDLVSIVKTIEIYDCTPVIIITIVGYDYFLTFSREIDAVWRRPWTLVSALFVIVRYIGLILAVTLSLAGSTFVPGPVSVGIAIVAVGDWGYMVFLAAADFVMILRVAAMWNRSKIVFGILLLIYVPQMIVTVVWDAIWVDPGKSLSVTILRVLDFKSCGYSSSVAPPATYRAIPRFVLGAALLILAAIPTAIHSFEMYKVTKRWQINRTMKLLIKEGSVYFVVNLLFNIVNAIQLPIVDLMMLLDALGYALSCAVMPRFIISIRELYDRDLQERWQGIDTGFGRVSDQSSGGSESMSTAMMGVILGENNPEAIELEDLRTSLDRVDQKFVSDPNFKVLPERSSDISIRSP